MLRGVNTTKALLQVQPSCSSSTEDEALAGVCRKLSLRERFVTVSHLGSQRTLWCELPEVIR